MTSVHRRSMCRLCEGRGLDLALALAPSAIANAYVPADRLNQPQETYPLDVYRCRSCGHLQLLHVVDPGVLFSDYIYTSSSSPGLVEHFRRYAADLIERVGPG